MDLFNIYYNQSMQCIMEAINTAARTNTPLDYKAFKQALWACFPNVNNFDVEKDIFEQLQQTYEANHKLQNVSLPYMPTRTEKEFISWMLESEDMTSLLGPKLTHKLQQSIAGENIMKLKDVWQPRFKLRANLSDKDLAHRHHILATAYEAMHQGCMIHYESHDEYGRVYGDNMTELVAPYKLEYSFWNDSYNFIMWHPQKKWTFKSDIQDITKLELLDTPIPEEMLQAADEYVQNKQQQSDPLVLRLKNDEKNRFERCFSLLASYDKEVMPISDDVLELKVYYCDFDLEELIMLIHSLGSLVTVISPQSIRQRIIDELLSWDQASASRQ